MLSAKLGHSLDPLIIKVYKIVFFKREINPNVLTLLGFLFGIGCFVSVVFGYLALGGIFLIISGFFDLVDGSLARGTKRVTVFGGFLDSVLDRYTDLLVLSGIGIHFLLNRDIHSVVITIISSVGVAIIPYVKARAQAEGLNCDTGILERPERTILLIVGLIFSIVEYCMIILAFLSHITVFQRVLFVKRHSEALKTSE
ncbi:MAG: CDP-alcohol phosphatidyltransferase family protein [Deltaproteobacteria bacterium]|nr:CDP-alcohol phosphatidyltransferase family protein [Deltaproteobacteria bacterium]